MIFAETNMGLLGLSSAVRSDPKWKCVASSPGSPLAEKLCRGAGRIAPVTRQTASRRSLDVYVGYFEHRELGLWSVNPRAECAASRVLADLCTMDPGTVILTSTRSALTVQKGFSLLALVDMLRDRDYHVCWLRVAAVDQGLPHDAHYTLVVGARDVGSRGAGALLTAVASALGYGLGRLGVPLDAQREREQRRPRLGVSRGALRGLPSAGFLMDGDILEQRVRSTRLALDPSVLARCVCPQLADPHELRAVRLVSRGGIKGVSVKPVYASFALGPGVSARPLFAIRSQHIDSRVRELILNRSNWSVEREGWLVWRLDPANAVLLHGEEAGHWERPLGESSASLQEKYSLLAKGCPPRILAKVVLAAMGSSSTMGRAHAKRDPRRGVSREIQ